MVNYKIYIELGNHNCINKLLSTAFYTEKELEERGAIYIDTISLEDNSDIVNGQYLQNNYFVNKFGKSVLDDNGNPNYKYIDRVLGLTEEEKTALFPPAEDYSKEKLLWSGALPKGQSVKINGLEKFNYFKINAGSVGEIVVSRQNITDKRFNANSSSTNAGVYYFRFINIIVDLETETITNDGCYYSTVQNITTSPTKFENITEIWGIV